MPCGHSRAACFNPLVPEPAWNSGLVLPRKLRGIYARACGRSSAFDQTLLSGPGYRSQARGTWEAACFDLGQRLLRETSVVMSVEMGFRFGKEWRQK